MLTDKTYSTVDGYICTFPDEVQQVMQSLRTLIHEEVAEVDESIRYDMPTFSLRGKYAIYFAGWKNHISLYPFTDSMEKLLSAPSEYKTSGKGTIQFPLNKPLPLQLIRDILKIRLKEMTKE